MVDQNALAQCRMSVAVVGARFTEPANFLQYKHVS